MEKMHTWLALTSGMITAIATICVFCKKIIAKRIRTNLQKDRQNRRKPMQKLSCKFFIRCGSRNNKRRNTNKKGIRSV